MPFHSILSEHPEDPGAPEPTEPPECFANLHLDEIVASMTSSREGFRLAPFYYVPANDVETIGYRHEVFRNLEDDGLRGVLRAFAAKLQSVLDRADAAKRIPYRYEQERWTLDAASAYAEAILELSHRLDRDNLRARGLRAFAEYLGAYAASAEFKRLVADADHVTTELASVRYRLRIQGGRVTVSGYLPEPDYGAEVLETFEKFNQGTARDDRWRFDQVPTMNHVQAAIVDRLARLYPDVFAALDAAYLRHRDFLDATIARFAHEIGFYVAYLEHIAPLRRAGLPFCYPEVVERPNAIRGADVFDLALAAHFMDDGAPIVTNDFELTRPERILVISGPNQGGKTTFARTIGQLHHLARIGVPVPGRAARLPLVDQIFTHFGQAEEVEDLTSRLEDDLLRIRRILDAATVDSLVVMNESFSSTTVSDQLFIGRRVLRRMIDCGLLGVVVTFLDELASLDATTVSMLSTVDPMEPDRRTFRIVRRPADGLAYAMAIAEKHRLTYRAVRERVTG